MAQSVTLDGLRSADAANIVSALTDIDTTRWLTSVPVPYGLEQAHHFIAAAGPDEYAIRVDGAFAGVVRAGDGLGYWVAPGFRRRGIARRAAVLALSRSFAQGRSEIVASYVVENDASAALLAQLGFGLPQHGSIFSVRLGHEVPAVRLTLKRSDFEDRHGIALTTSRLVIDRVQDTDLPALYAIATAPEVARMLFIFAPDMPRHDFAAIFPSKSLVPPFRLAIRHGGAVIGSIGIGRLDEPGGPSIYYFMSPDSWGQGLGREVLEAFLSEIDARLAPAILQASVFEDNPASAKMLERFGFGRTGRQMLWSAGRGGLAPGWNFLRQKS